METQGKKNVKIEEPEHSGNPGQVYCLESKGAKTNWEGEKESVVEESWVPHQKMQTSSRLVIGLVLEDS